MPIKSLQQLARRPPVIGKLRKGAPKGKNRPGRDLDHFRFVSNVEGLEELFVQEYGAEPRSLEVFLPYNLAELNFTAWQEHWVAGGLMHQCDGEYCHLLYDDESRKMLRDESLERYPCPGECSPVGRLYVIVPKLNRAGVVVVETHSVNDIVELESRLAAYEHWTARRLMGIPFELARRKRAISTPGTSGKRVRREKSLLTLEPHVDAFEPRFQAALARMNNTPPALPGIAEPETANVAPTVNGSDQVETVSRMMLEGATTGEMLAAVRQTQTAPPAIDVAGWPGDDAPMVDKLKWLRSTVNAAVVNDPYKNAPHMHNVLKSEMSDAFVGWPTVMTGDDARQFAGALIAYKRKKADRETAVA